LHQNKNLLTVSSDKRITTPPFWAADQKIGAKLGAELGNSARAGLRKRGVDFLSPGIRLGACGAYVLR
jgi:hypothetical protein